MKLKAQAGKILGRSKEEVWGQVFQGDNLFLVAEASVPEEFEAAPLGKEIINTLSLRLNELAAINLKNLKKLLSLKDGRLLGLKAPEGAVVNLLLCVLADNVFYLLVFGRGKAFLKRGEKMAALLEKEGSGSGILKEDDLLILSSPKFSKLISLETLKSNLNHLPPQEIAENLAPLVHAQENSFGAAAMILKFNKSETSEFEEEEETTLDKQTPTSPFKSQVSSLRKKVGKFNPLFFLKRKAAQEEPTKRMVLTVALILIGLLLVSIVFGFNKRQKGGQEERFEQVFESATNQYEEGKALLPLNTQKSREVLKEAKVSLEKALEGFRKGSKERRKIEELLANVEVSLKEAEKIYKLADAPLYFDPVFLKDQASGDKLALYKESLAILDKEQNTLYHLFLKEKEGKIIAGGEKLQGARLVGIHGDRVYALVEGGIVETMIANQTSTIKIKKDDDWGKIAALAAYRGNVYLLDQAGEIIKYLSTEEGFPKRAYLAPGTEVDFSSATSMAIDGDIWVALASEVLRFSLGQRQAFTPKGLEKSFGEKLLVYTDEEAENLYILDRGEKRVVVLNKEGEYQAQYEWEKMATASDFVVSEEEGKILILVEGKIYGVDIKS